MSSQLPVETPKASVTRIMAMLRKRLDPMVYAQIFSPLNVGIEEVAKSRGHFVSESTEHIIDYAAPIKSQEYYTSHIEGDGGFAKDNCRFCQRGEHKHVRVYYPTKQVIIPGYYIPLRCKYDNNEIPIGSPLIRLTVDKGMQNRRGRAIAFSEEFHSYECLLADLQKLLKTFRKDDWKY